MTAKSAASRNPIELSAALHHLVISSTIALTRGELLMTFLLSA